MSISVMKFAIKMEEELIENNHKQGWDGLSLRWILNRIKQETGELERAIEKKLPNKKIQSECADIANFCMMMFDNLEEDTHYEK